MRRIAVLFAGVIVVAGLLGAACGSDQQHEQAGPEQSQTVSAVPQQEESQAGQSAQPEEPQPQSTPGDTGVQEQREPSAEPQPAQAQRRPAEPQRSQAAQQSAESTQQEQPTRPEQSGQPERETPEQAQVQSAQEDTKIVIGGDRPATLLLPREADRSQPRPLIMLLHGYGSFALQADQYFRFSLYLDQGGYGLLLPNGTRDRNGVPFWNGTDECCDLFSAEPDDVGYLKSLIEEARNHAAFDQIYVVGHSNGGFMAYRLACEEVPGLSGIVSLAGGAHSEADDCRAPTPLSVLQIHGTEDDLVLYETGRLPVHPDPDRKPVPGARESVTRWAERAGCALEAVEELPAIDTDASIEGDETTVRRYEEACAEGAVMELWTIEGGGHVPIVWDTDFAPEILRWIGERYEQAAQLVEPSATAVEETGLRGDEPRALFASLRWSFAGSRAS